jgi:hypothetical protein
MWDAEARGLFIPDDDSDAEADDEDESDADDDAEMAYWGIGHYDNDHYDDDFDEDEEGLYDYSGL